MESILQNNEEQLTSEVSFTEMFIIKLHPGRVEILQITPQNLKVALLNNRYI